MDDLLDRLQPIFREVLEDDFLVITPDSSASGANGFALLMMEQATAPTSKRNTPSMDRYFIPPPGSIGTSRLRMFSRFFIERFPIEHVPLRTALDDPA